MKPQKYFWLTNLVLKAAMIGLLFFGASALYILVYIAIFLIMLNRTILTRGLKRVKLLLISVYGFLLVCQIVLAAQLLIFPGIPDEDGILIDLPFGIFWLRRIVCTLVVTVPLVISRYVVVGKYAQFYLPSIQEAGAIGFAELRDVATKATLFTAKMERAKEGLAVENFREVFKDLPRHDSFNYVNDGTLTESYFEKADNTLSDLHLYLIITHTGGAENNIISVFTNRSYNHVSLAFDRELETAVSYNGGNNVYPPGMNPEMLEDFIRKDGDSIMVYNLPCSLEQKSQVLRQIWEINEKGSAYNIIGLMTKRSYRPNIMFCSQFVYRMLKTAGLTYFQKADGLVEPTDFVELDYRRVLGFEYELVF